MIQAIKLEFAKNIEKMDWMDEKTRTYAKLKVLLYLFSCHYLFLVLCIFQVFLHYIYGNTVNYVHLGYIKRSYYCHYEIL